MKMLVCRKSNQTYKLIPYFIADLLEAKVLLILTYIRNLFFFKDETLSTDINYNFD